MKSLSILLASFLCYLNNSSAVTRQPEKYPLTITKDGFLVVDVRIADTVSARFILDTGVGIHVVAPSLLRKLSAIPRGEFTGFRHSGERLDFEIFQLEELSIGTMRQERPVVAQWSFLDSVHIDGILSLNFFKQYPFTLDLLDSVLVFETEESLKELASNTQRTSLSFSDNRGKSFEVFTNISLSDSLNLECLIDTGSPATIVNARYLSILGIDTASNSVRKKISQNPFGSIETQYIVSLPSIALTEAPAIRAEHMKMIFKHRLIYEGLIGIDFLIGRRLSFDLPREVLFISAKLN